MWKNGSACWKEADASLELAAELMKRNNGDWGKDTLGLKVGDKVWLDGKNLKTTQPKAKLAAKRHGPFEITDVLGPVTYKLDIPRTWKRVHPVFHASLLTPYVETEAHGPNFERPPAELVEGQEEVEVEEVLDSRPTRNKRGIEYLVKWKGYPDTENEWLSRTKLPHAQEAIAEFHQAHPKAHRPVNHLVFPHTQTPITLQEKACLKEGVMLRILLRLSILMADRRPTYRSLMPRASCSLHR